MTQGGPTVGELLPDDGAALAFMGVEYVNFLDYCRREIQAALDTLPPEYAALLRLYYLEGKTLRRPPPFVDCPVNRLPVKQSTGLCSGWSTGDTGGSFGIAWLPLMISGNTRKPQSGIHGQRPV